MKPEPAAPPGRRPQGRLPGALFALAVFALVLAACGISLGVEQNEKEILRQLTVEGDFRPGGALSLILEYTQQYPVAIDVVCELLDKESSTATPEATPTSIAVSGVTPTPSPVHISKARPTPANRVLQITAEALPPNPEGGPVGEATPVAGTIKRGFTVPRPGRYVVRCFTPGDDSNKISETITIAPASTLTPEGLFAPAPSRWHGEELAWGCERSLAFLPGRA